MFIEIGIIQNYEKSEHHFFFFLFWLRKKNKFVGVVTAQHHLNPRMTTWTIVEHVNTEHTTLKLGCDKSQGHQNQISRFKKKCLLPLPINPDSVFHKSRSQFIMHNNMMISIRYPIYRDRVISNGQYLQRKLCKNQNSNPSHPSVPPSSRNSK